MRALALALVALLAVAAPAHAIGRSAADVRALAAQAAAGDAGALRELRATDAVDGQPADLSRALATSDTQQLRARLRSLAAAPSAARGGDPARAARAIVAEDRFRPADSPQPFKRFFRRAGDRVRDAFDAVDGSLPGGSGVLWALIAAIGLAVAAVLASRNGRRLQYEARDRELADLGAERRNPDELERDADRAQADGDAAQAVRLRFRAGLLRLDAREVIVLRPSLTTGQVRRELRDATFDEIARTFDEVTYGERPATDDDVEAARGGWPRVLDGARR